MDNIKDFLNNKQNRKYLYRVVIALLVISVPFGLLTESEVLLISNAVIAILGLTLADVKVYPNNEEVVANEPIKGSENNSP